MEIIVVLLPASVILAALALGAYFWAARSGQFDDLETPPQRVLFDDDDNKA
ncbi:MAG: cbb3-type cytochrome oxidase assembly protein CcoS [Oligoflexia bacterium]|nr:cbb3-type cytochrome oxidase assembly protein CcoS [Oligoflexia bacterium]